MTIRADNTLQVIPLNEVEGEPCALDLELAERLEFERPRDIRKLIKRHLKDLQRFGPIRASWRKSDGPGRPAKEFWLNEEQAVFITSKSNTPKAADVSVAIVRTFVAWRRGHLQPPNERRPGLSPQSAQDVGGIVKRGLQKNVPAIIDERIPPHLEQLQANILDGVGRLLEGTARQEGSSGPAWITTDGALELAGITSRAGLKGLSRWLSPRLQRYCAALNSPAEQRVHGGVKTWFFRLDLVERFLRDGGREAIEKKVVERRSQGTLPFVDDPAERRPGRRRSRLH